MAGDDSSFRGARSTALNAIQALGRGFDVTCDIRLLYCKGTPGSRLLNFDEDHTADLELPEGLRIPDVSVDIKWRPKECARESSGVLNFEEMSELFNKKSSIAGNTPLGMFNTMFGFSGSWQMDASLTKSLAVDGWIIPLYSLHLKAPFILCDEVERAVPTTWDPAALASFIEKYGTHVIISVEVGGKDMIYVKQHQSSSLSESEMKIHLKKLADSRFQDAEYAKDKGQKTAIFTTQRNRLHPSNADGSTSQSGKEDVTVIYRRRGGEDLVQGHHEWRQTVPTNPDVLSMSFVPIVWLLNPGIGTQHLNRATELYLKYKPPLEELQYFLDFQVPRSWAPVANQPGANRKEPVCPTLQFSLMGPKLSINTNQVSVGRKPVTGLRLCLEGNKLNRLAIHIQHVSVLPKILQPHWDAYIPIGAPKWHGPEEQDSRWFEPVQWNNFSHVSTAPVEFGENLFEDVSGAYIVTGAQLGVWDFGLKSVLYLKLLYSKVPGCTIRRSVWDHTPAPSTQKLKGKPSSKKEVPGSNYGATAQSQKLFSFVDTEEISRGPQDMPGHWLLTGAKLGVEKSKIFLRVKYSLLNY